jgi:AraC-like DNA-binding protein
MPIYMDRHDVSETVTAEIVAQLHQQDLKIQDQFRCRGLTYWFDDKRKTAFCLVEAPDKKAIQKMHRFAHGEVPNKIIEVDPKIVESFLGRIEDPEKAKDTSLNIINDPAFRTIMVIGFESFSHKKRNSAQFTSLMNDYHDVILKLIIDYDGTLVKEADCYFLISFQSVTKAVHAALEIKTSLHKRDNILLKFGLSSGSPVTEKRLFFEDTIKLAERMCKTVKGEIIISSEVKELYNSENSSAITEGESVVFLSETDENFLTLLMDYTESAWFNTNLKVEDLNKPVGCSKSQLYRKLISLTGKSPNTFIKEYRLNEALALLNKNNRNVSEIAFETGFSSPSYFSKCFQKKFGYLPSAFSLSKVSLQSA